MLEELGRRAAVAVDSARVHRQRSAIARTLQNSLLPPVLPEIPGIETAALYRAAGEGIDVGGDFYDLFARRRRRVDRRDRRRLRQGRRGGGRHRARALHDPHRGGPAAVAGGDPALAQRRDVPPGPRRALLHDRVRAPRHVAAGDPRHGRVRRASAGAAAARGRRGRGARGRGHAARARARPGSSRTRAPSCTPATRSSSTRTASPRRARRSACSAPEDLRAALRTQRRRTRRSEIVERLAALAVGKEGTPPRDDIAILALRARG